MSESKGKSAIKPKFAPPVSQARCKSSKGEAVVAEIKSHENDGNSEGAALSAADEPGGVGNKKQSICTNYDESNERSSVKRSLTDSQYEDLFRAVQEKIKSGNVGDLENGLHKDDVVMGMSRNDEMKESPNDEQNSRQHKKKSKKLRKSEPRSETMDAIEDVDMLDTCDGAELDFIGDMKKQSDAAADAFTKIVSGASPNLKRRNNEITPNTSPLEENTENFLARAPKPKKETAKERKEKRKAGKRKSLGYEKVATVSEEASTEVKPSFKPHDPALQQEHQTKGTWVQCVTCEKWRYLAGCSDPASLPDSWTCVLNPDQDCAMCDAPESEWEELSQESYIYTQFTPGSIVWAKIAGYPAWPAMVDMEPDFGSFYETFPDGNVSHYHVVFLDEQVSRAWVSYRHIEPFRKDQTSVKLVTPRKGRSQDYSKEVEAARSRGCQALGMEIGERISKFGFQQRYKGKTKWAEDKNTTERKAKKLKPKKSPKVKSGEKNDKKVEADVEAESKTKIEETINEKPRDEEYVSETESDDNIDYWSKVYDDENINSFSSMMINEKDSSEKPLCTATLGDACLNGISSEDEQEIEQRKIEYDPEIYTMEMGQEINEPIDLSQKKSKGIVLENATDDVPLDLSGKKSSSSPFLTPQGQTDVLEAADISFQDLGLSVDEDIENKANEAPSWEEFDQLVMME